MGQGDDFTVNGNLPLIGNSSVILHTQEILSD
jgi:hypothetical protein